MLDTISIEGQDPKKIWDQVEYAIRTGLCVHWGDYRIYGVTYEEEQRPDGATRSRLFAAEDRWGVWCWIRDGRVCYPTATGEEVD